MSVANTKHNKGFRMEIQAILLVVIVLIGEKTVVPMSRDKTTVDPMGGEEKTVVPMSRDKTTVDPMGGEEKTVAPMRVDKTTVDPIDKEEKTALPMSGKEKTIAPESVEEKIVAPMEVQNPTANITTDTPIDNDLIECDECTQEVVQLDGKYFCKARPVNLSAFVAKGSCKCECGEGEQIETRTCSAFERRGQTCIVNTLDSVPENSSHPCASFSLNRKTKCEKTCSKRIKWLDEYVDVGECQKKWSYLCGKCTDGGNQLQFRKCKAWVKTESECAVIKTEAPSICGVDQRTISCEPSDTHPCFVEELNVYTLNKDDSGTNDEIYYTGWDKFGNKCELKNFDLEEDDTEMGSQTIYEWVSHTCNDVCLDYRGFEKMTLRIDGTDGWRGNVFVRTYGVYSFYHSDFKWLDSKETITLKRREYFGEY